MRAEATESSLHVGEWLMRPPLLSVLPLTDKSKDQNSPTPRKQQFKEPGAPRLILESASFISAIYFFFFSRGKLDQIFTHFDSQ
jgi:hypothetical protein